MLWSFGARENWLLFDIGLAVLCFYSKTGFWPSYCQISTDLDKILHTHLLLYGIHLWADLDRDRRVGGSRPNQNDCVFVILVTHPKRRRIAAILAVHCQSGGEDGCYRDKFRNFVACTEPDPTWHFFRVFRLLSTPAHSLQETVLPQTNGTDEKPRFSKCAFC